MTRGASVVVVLWAGAAFAATPCPCYSSLSTPNPDGCGVADSPGTEPTTAEWSAMIDSASLGPADPAWTGTAVPQVHNGCGSSAQLVDARFPCELVEAILMQESTWRQFCAPTDPADRIGASARTLVTEDCGYGIAQVTTDMHKGETAIWDRDRVASDPRYAIEVGLLILAQKWTTVACVGANNPNVVEDWYLATWAYNSYAYVNSPNNPNYDAVRTICDPNVGCSARPYQEHVWGWMEHPPSDGRWPAIQPAYPALASLPKTSALPNTLPEPACAEPTSCAAKRTTHTSRCAANASDGGSGALDFSLFGDAGDAASDLAGDDLATGAHATSGCGCEIGARPRRDGLSWSLLILSSFALLLVRRRRWR